MVEQTETGVLLAGQTGVGKSSIANMIMGKPDGSQDAAGVSGDARPCTTETKSYVTQLEGIRCRLWDTRGLDEAVDNPGFLPKLRDLFRQPDRGLRAACRERIKEAAPILVWCIHASKIDVPIHWQQFRKVYVDYCGGKVKPVVVLTKMTDKTANDWESRCRVQLREIGLCDTGVVLSRVREYKRLSTPEYLEDAQALKELIVEVARQELHGST